MYRYCLMALSLACCLASFAVESREEPPQHSLRLAGGTEPDTCYVFSSPEMCPADQLKKCSEFPCDPTWYEGEDEEGGEVKKIVWKCDGDSYFEKVPDPGYWVPELRDAVAGEVGHKEDTTVARPCIATGECFHVTDPDKDDCDPNAQNVWVCKPQVGGFLPLSDDKDHHRPDGEECLGR